MAVTLRDKFYGCIAGSHIGSAMGAAVEGWSYAQIEEKYGLLDRLLPYEHYGNGWVREPGTTEDGIERQKLMIAAIVTKGGRVNAEDVRAAWLAHANPEAGGLISEPFERTLLAMAGSGIPARDIGKYCDYAGLNSFARACHAIALINAGNVKTAMEDVLEVGQLYQTSNSKGLQWACVTGAAIASATRPDATADSVIGAVFDACHPDMVVRELERHVTRTRGITDIRELRVYFDNVYNGFGMPYAHSYANEVVTKGLAIFQMAGGNLRDAIIAGVNMGRDTDCVAAVAAGISGALGGSSALPAEWAAQVDHAASVNPHSCTQRSLQETAEVLYQAFQNRLKAERAYVELMEIPS